MPAYIICIASSNIQLLYNSFLGKYCSLFQPWTHAEDRDDIIQAWAGFEEYIWKTSWQYTQ